VKNPEDPIALEELSENELGQSHYNYIKYYAQRHNFSYRKALYDIYSNEHHSLNRDGKYKIQKYIAQIANIVNLKTFYNFSQLLDEIISDSNQEEFLFINRYAKNLQDPDEAINLTNIEMLDFSEKRIFVYHDQDKIAYIAKNLMTTVFKRPVENIKNINKKNRPSDGVLFELMPSGHEYDDLLHIPIYSLCTESRHGVLSNLFKYLQWYDSCNEQKYINSYIVIDLETTDPDASSCGIVEIAAVRVENDKITSELKSLIKPDRPISRAAQKIHKISDKDVAGAPTIEAFWNDLISFIDDFILVAHNGYAFDFIILDRMAKKIDGKKLPNPRLDSLALARNLFPNQSNSLDALMERFKLSSTTRHRALDDVRILVKIFRQLDFLKMKILNRTRLQMHLDFVALGNVIENKVSAREDRIFFIAGARKLLTSYAKIRSEFARDFNLDEDVLTKEIHNRLFQIQPQSDLYRNDEHLLNKVRNMTKEYEKMSIDAAIAKFLSYISLHTGQDELEDIDAVSLLTFHAAKGLEFDKVILLGLEKDNMPGFHATRDDVDDDRPIPQKVEEQRRLFYVGITRAKSELILTTVKNRGGWERQSSPFLKDLAIPYTLKEVK
jgi:DNA polymerase III epsilon subunit family exonuclease